MHKPLSPALKEAVIIDWRLGEMSMAQIADKHSISKGSVHKLCHGIERDGRELVNAGVAYRTALQQFDERFVNAVDKEVSKKAQWLEWLDSAHMRNASDAMKVKCNDQNDFLMRSRMLSNAKESIVGKAPTTAIQINNTNQQLDERERERERLRNLTPEQLAKIEEVIENG